jgi:nucleoside transporter
LSRVQPGGVPLPIIDHKSFVFFRPPGVLSGVQREFRWADYTELSALMFLHAMAMGAWFVPLGPVLDAHGYHSIKAFAFATSATAAFVSPLIFGAIADRHVAPVRVLRWLAFATALAMALAAIAIQRGENRWIVLGVIQLHALCSAPTWGLSTSIVMSQLTNSQRQFGNVRLFGTIGWMAGCWLVSALRADSSTVACFTGAIVWVVVGLFTWLLPAITPKDDGTRSTFKQRFGLDAFELLKNPDHRVVFLTTALFAIPLAAFYPFAPAHLKSLGMERTSAWMTIGQISEVIAMLGLAAVLARCRFKWAFAAGLGFGFVRYALCALDGKGWVLLGVSLHGFAYTLFFITAQIYVDQRIDPAFRARAQALLSVMLTGVGNLCGYLGTGWWFEISGRDGLPHWRLFWGGLAIVVAGVAAFYLLAYRGLKQKC